MVDARRAWVREHLDAEVVDLRLHARCEQAFAGDPELFRAHRARQDRLRQLQRLYRYRLDFAIQPARVLLERRGDREILDPEREAAIEAVRDSLSVGAARDSSILDVGFEAGKAIAIVGDVNGDTYDDILIGAPMYDIPFSSNGIGTT